MREFRSGGQGLQLRDFAAQGVEFLQRRFEVAAAGCQFDALGATH